MLEKFYCWGLRSEAYLGYSSSLEFTFKDSSSISVDSTNIIMEEN